MNKFIKSTLMRCVRTFFTTILGVWTAGTLITDVDWKTTLLGAFSATVYVFILCIVAGIPEADNEKALYMNYDEPEDAEVEEDENEN